MDDLFRAVGKQKLLSVLGGPAADNAGVGEAARAATRTDVYGASSAEGLRAPGAASQPASPLGRVNHAASGAGLANVVAARQAAAAADTESLVHAAGLVRGALKATLTWNLLLDLLCRWRVDGEPVLSSSVAKDLTGLMLYGGTNRHRLLKTPCGTLTENRTTNDTALSMGLMAEILKDAVNGRRYTQAAAAAALSEGWVSASMAGDFASDSFVRGGGRVLAILESPAELARLKEAMPAEFSGVERCMGAKLGALGGGACPRWVADGLLSLMTLVCMHLKSANDPEKGYKRLPAACIEVLKAGALAAGFEASVSTTKLQSDLEELSTLDGVTISGPDRARVRRELVDNLASAKRGLESSISKLRRAHQKFAAQLRAAKGPEDLIARLSVACSESIAVRAMGLNRCDDILAIFDATTGLFAATQTDAIAAGRSSRHAPQRKGRGGQRRRSLRVVLADPGNSADLEARLEQGKAARAEDEKLRKAEEAEILIEIKRSNRLAQQGKARLKASEKAESASALDATTEARTAGQWIQALLTGEATRHDVPDALGAKVTRGIFTSIFSVNEGDWFDRVGMDPARLPEILGVSLSEEVAAMDGLLPGRKLSGRTVGLSTWARKSADKVCNLVLRNGQRVVYAKDGQDYRVFSTVPAGEDELVCIFAVKPAAHQMQRQLRALG